ncbi:hypothetical protein LENED_001058 [Lentinula edodes]|uniref:Uncharacterized protein n=1 Tax=Lentinula edodes TaxID=5353 RepID=A0A1Q3DX60_LENED|nr:hypothetical protein LENED_001058 [Lentinula edodes]
MFPVRSLEHSLSLSLLDFICSNFPRGIDVFSFVLTTPSSPVFSFFPLAIIARNRLGTQALFEEEYLR